MKKCDEVMTKKPVCYLPNNMAAKAAQLMKRKKTKGVRSC